MPHVKLSIKQNRYLRDFTCMVTSNTVYAWHKRWRQQGVAGLRDGHRTDRPGKAYQASIDDLGRLLERDPRELGLPLTIPDH